MPERRHLCHCRMCQKAVGGPFAAFALVRCDDFAWTRGKAAKFDSSNIAYRHYCADCDTPLTFGYHPKEWINVTIGRLDEPERAVPERQYGTESRIAWYTPAALERLPGLETEVTAGGRVVAVTSDQHPDHDTRDGWTAPRR